MKPSGSFHPSRILCPVDFNWLSDLALKYAAVGARVFDATLVVFHATRLEVPAYFTSGLATQLTRQLETETRRAKDFLRLHVRNVLGREASRIRLRFDVAEGGSVPAILNATRKHRAELIVLGTHGRVGAKRLWLGSVTENITHQAAVPVFVVRQKQHEFISPMDPQALPRLNTILCPINFRAASRAALAHATSLARRFNARLITPCIIERGDPVSSTQARRKMTSWDRPASAGHCDTRIVVRKGRAAEQIVAIAAGEKADLVVLGAQRSGSLQTWLWGDTTESVLRHASAPVLVVPQ